jgi:hypothetical protein
MTSEATNDETLAFFKKFEYFGLPEDQVLFFEQGDYPALSNDGKILMSVRRLANDFFGFKLFVAAASRKAALLWPRTATVPFTKR